MMKNLVFLAAVVAAEDPALTDSINAYLKANPSVVDDACYELIVAAFSEGDDHITINDFCAGTYDDADALGAALEAEWEDNNDGSTPLSESDCTGKTLTTSYAAIGALIVDAEETLCADYVASSAFSASLTLGALATLALRLM